MPADDDAPDAVQQIAGRRVIATVNLVFDEGTDDQWTEPHHVLDNGALVATDAIVGRNVKIGSGTIIESGCVIGDNVAIAPLCRVGDKTRIGDGCTIQERTVVEHECELGNHVTLEEQCYVGAVNHLPAESHLAMGVVVPLETYHRREHRPPVRIGRNSVIRPWYAEATIDVPS